jgi:tetratricopeptide (TPR) repeat protein
VIAVALVCLPVAAAAQSPRERALDLFVQSEDHYRQGDFAGAIELLLEARELHPEPVLLYNLARAYEGLGRFEEALGAYRDYLDEDPETRDRGAIERRIASLETELDERRRLEEARERDRGAADAPARARPSTGPPEDEASSDIAPWIVGIVGLSIVGAGAGVALAADARRSDAEEDPVHASSRQSFRDARDLATVANVVMAAGGLVAAGALVWILLSGGGEERGEDVSVAIGPGGLAVSGTHTLF